MQDLAWRIAQQLGVSPDAVKVSSPQVIFPLAARKCTVLLASALCAHALLPLSPPG